MSVRFCLVFRFSRGSVQTTIPFNRQNRGARLCASYDDQISELNKSKLGVQEEVQQFRRRKRDEEDKLRNLKQELQSVKVITIAFLFFIVILSLCFSNA